MLFGILEHGVNGGWVLSRLRDYASAATGSFGGGDGPSASVDPRFKPGIDGVPGGRYGNRWCVVQGRG